MPSRLLFIRSSAGAAQVSLIPGARPTAAPRSPPCGFYASPASWIWISGIQEFIVSAAYSLLQLQASLVHQPSAATYSQLQPVSVVPIQLISQPPVARPSFFLRNSQVHSFICAGHSRYFSLVGASYSVKAFRSIPMFYPLFRSS